VTAITVLLADDHAVMRDGLRAMLETTPDITVVGEAATGREVLQRAAELQPSAVIMDVAMPDLNGIEATGLLRVRHPQIKVIMLSMHTDKEHVYRALEAGATGYLLKESAGGEVATAIRMVVAGRTYLSPSLQRHSDVRSDGAPVRSPLSSLSPRERQVLQLVAEGLPSSAIAKIVHLSPKSVDTYRSRLMKKLGVRDISSLIKFAIQHGITPPG